MADRRAFAAVLSDGRRAMDAERAAFAAEVVAVVRRVATGDAFTAFDRARILAVLDAPGGAFDRFYGRFRGDAEARLYKLVVRQCRAARAVAWGRAERMVRRLLRGQPDLLAAIEREAV